MFNKTTFLLSLLTLYPLSAFADAPLLINNQSLVNGCTTTNIGAYSGTVTMVANFQINSYRCVAGYYLPANGIECAACPSASYCAGGTYTYNASSAQGVVSNPNGSCVNATIGHTSGTVTAVPQFTANSYTCAAGQYLPADGVECVACLPGATCNGGTYTFNETADQGLSCSGVMYRGACHTRCNVNQGRLHADQYSHPLFADKINMPSPVLHIQYIDGTMCYGYLEPGFAPAGEHGIHILYNGAVYHAVNPGD